jgi:uncharacterized protein (DUF3084 family)
MATPEESQAGRGLLSSIAGARDVLIILAAFAVLAPLGIFIVQHYSTADDAAAVLGVVIPAISTIAGTAFGVAAGVRAGAATAEAAQTETRAARTETEARRSRTTDVYANLAKATTKLEPVIEAAGTTTQLPANELQEARTRLEDAEQSLKAAL